MKRILIQSYDHRRWMIWVSSLWMAAALLAVPAAQADIYFWQDEQGVIHFSNQDAPPNASLYMREPVAVAASPVAESVKSSAAAENALAAKLEQTNRQLSRALERVDELTEKVKDSEQAAAAAAAAAQQAARQASDNAVRTDPAPTYEKRPHVVYYAAPGIHRPAKYRRGYHTPPHKHRYRHHTPPHHSHYRHDRIKRHHRLSHHGNFRRPVNQRHRIHMHQQPKWPVPHRKWIPKAYGVR